MRSKGQTIRNILICVVLIATPTIWMTMNVLNDVKASCTVCMSFNNRENCGRAEGPDKETCIHTAKDNACALIASGMTASIQCSQKEPLSVEVK